MKTWIDLYTRHRGMRTVAASWATDLRKRLIALSDAGYCEKTIRGRFSALKRGDLSEWSIRKNREQASEPLTNLSELASAELTVLGLVSSRDHLHSFTISVEGRRGDGSSWALAVHLPDDRETESNKRGDRQGLGACSHAALHCHVGPDLDTEPAVRVPLPALSPVEALEWVLSQLVPTIEFEAAPWGAVEEILQKATR